MGHTVELYVTVVNGKLSLDDLCTAINEMNEDYQFSKAAAYDVLWCDASTWFDYDTTFTVVSQRFPLAIIAVDIHPEELYFNGITRIYYCGGKSQEVDADIVFPPCTLKLPKMHYRTVYVTLAGVDIPVEIECLESLSDDEAYTMARDILRRQI